MKCPKCGGTIVELYDASYYGEVEVIASFCEECGYDPISNSYSAVWGITLSEYDEEVE